MLLANRLIEQGESTWLRLSCSFGLKSTPLKVGGWLVGDDGGHRDFVHNEAFVTKLKWYLLSGSLEVVAFNVVVTRLVTVATDL